LALPLAGLVALQRTWEPGQTLASFGQKVWSSVPVVGPRLRLVSNQAQFQIGPAKSDSVVMVDSTIIESPRSDAYTANLYASTGKDLVPWPNVGGRATLETYIVQPGNSLWEVAEQFELDIDTLRWSNPELERNPDILTIGAELRILPVPGVYHFVAADETVESIAAQYGVAPTDITDYPPNALFPPYDLESGTGLIIPYGRKNIVTPKPLLAPGADLAWPLVGVITNGFKPDHLAIDIGAPYGTTVFAAHDGTITYADWAQTGYGYTIIIDHGDGRETWYNHLKGTLLGTGNFVSRGTPIGEVGSTGHSTGPHLHLELRINGERVTPLDYLPGETPR
jgi:murein DD-endopeptidase MepM/ murein hydrolase activator NlpD